MREMIRRFLRQKFGSVGVDVALAALALLSIPALAASGGRNSGGTGVLAVVILAARSVSKDASSGALQMILARPIPRFEYLFGRYLGILSAHAIFLAVTGLAAILASPALAHVFGGAELSREALARQLVTIFLQGALVAATLLFFSTFLPGFGDVLAYFLLVLLVNLPEGLAGALRNPAIARAGRIARDNLFPEPSWENLAGSGGLPSATAGRFVLALTISLALAALVFSHREFSYGQD